MPQDHRIATGRSMLELTNNLRTIALQKPNDPEAQRRAQASVDLYQQAALSQPFPLLTDPHPPAAIHQPANAFYRLPTEIYKMIIDLIVNDLEDCECSWNPDLQDAYELAVKERADTLAALACTCRLFQGLVELYLYKHPRSQKLQTWQYLCQFRFSIVIEPRRANLVQSLEISWDEADNKDDLWNLWVEIARLCPNTRRLSIGMEYLTVDNPIDEQLGNLFSACPNTTALNLSLGCNGFIFADLSAETDKQFRNFAKQLKYLKLQVPDEWIRERVLPYQFPNLTSLVLEVDQPFLDPEAVMLPEIAPLCPSLERLDLDSYNSIRLQNLIHALEIWGPTLRAIRIGGIKDRVSNPISQLIELLPVLEELRMGTFVPAYAQDMDALARHNPPCFKVFDCWNAASRGDFCFSSAPHLNLDQYIARGRISEEDREEGMLGYKAMAKLNDAMSALITAHAETLEVVWIRGRFSLSMDAIGGIKKAKRMKSICLPLCKELDQAQIDDFLAACPNLPAHPHFAGDIKARQSIVDVDCVDGSPKLLTFEHSWSNLSEARNEGSWGVRPPIRGWY